MEIGTAEGAERRWNGMVVDKLTVTIDLDITDAAVNKCLRVLEIWLENHSDKTIRVEDEDGVRVCMIEEVENG